MVIIRKLISNLVLSTWETECLDGQRILHAFHGHCLSLWYSRCRQSFPSRHRTWIMLPYVNQIRLRCDLDSICDRCQVITASVVILSGWASTVYQRQGFVLTVLAECGICLGTFPRPLRYHQVTCHNLPNFHSAELIVITMVRHRISPLENATTEQKTKRISLTSKKYNSMSLWSCSAYTVDASWHYERWMIRLLSCSKCIYLLWDIIVDPL